MKGPAWTPLPPRNWSPRRSAGTRRRGTRSWHATPGWSGRSRAASGSPTPTPRTSPRPPGCAWSKKLDTIKDPDHLPGWLATTAKREALRILRLAGRESPAFDEEAGDLPGPDEWLAQDPETLALLDDEYRRLWRAYAGLSESCRTLLWLVTVVPLGSYAEVSAALGMPIGSIGPTRNRCLDRLRSQLS